jgi:hypothetical protein
MPIDQPKEYDLFISHASEDKDVLVRDLAHALAESGVVVWYDEFTLSPGDSLRRSIDYGLVRSRFGLVVLSKSFFQKEWTHWELNGLVNRQMSDKTNVIIPLLFDLKVQELRNFSPSLADLVFLDGERDISTLVEEILAIVDPNRTDTKGNWIATIIKPENFEPNGVWMFPGFKIPNIGNDLSDFEKLKPSLLFRTRVDPLAKWAEHLRPSELLNRYTEPGEVYNLLQADENLQSVVADDPGYLAAVLPQLLLSGYSGMFEEFFEQALTNSERKYKELRERYPRAWCDYQTVQKEMGSFPLCASWIALRHECFGGYMPEVLTKTYFYRLSPAMMILRPQYPSTEEFQKRSNEFEKEIRNELTDERDLRTGSISPIENIAWLLSKKSDWLPAPLRQALIEGSKEIEWSWATGQKWYDLYIKYSISTAQQTNEIYITANPPYCGALFNEMCGLSSRRAVDEIGLSHAALSDLSNRFRYARKAMDLPEHQDELTERFLHLDFPSSWKSARTMELI